jgi:hypothetical protein
MTVPKRHDDDGSVMAKEIFVPRAMQAKTLAVVERANTIIDEFTAAGYTLTVRQLFYQFVGRDWIANEKQEYNNLQALIKNARNAGLIDWDAIEDRSRVTNNHNSWNNPSEIIAAAAKQYREDLWREQDYRPEVWIEKDALIGVIRGPCTEFRVPYYAHRGNPSTSDLYEAGKRFADIVSQGQVPLVLHLADHDPNGLDMTRDIRARLELYTRESVEVRRLGLNRDQVRRYRLPPNFAKEADTRYDAYVREFGEECWELDALRPDVLNALVRTELETLVDERAWRRAAAAEKRNRGKLAKAANEWSV